MHTTVGFIPSAMWVICKNLDLVEVTMERTKDCTYDVVIVSCVCVLMCVCVFVCHVCVCVCV